MTAAWIVQWANGETEAFDDERAAESRARELVASKTVPAAVVFRAEVEPEVRPWRAGTAIGAPNRLGTDPNANCVVLGRQIEETGEVA